MLFCPSTVSAMWDTWLHHHQGTWYLYYLITERGLGEGIGLATSPDGVHFADQGPVLGRADDALWLGTGSVWRSPAFDADGTFLANFSEWRGRDQVIHIAESRDLRSWRRLGPETDFAIDPRWYERTPRRWSWLFAPRSMPLMLLAMATGAARRWDSIHAVPRPEGGFHGYWTASVRGRPGFGFGQSADGRRWEALAPPEIDWGPLPPPHDVELGAVEPIGGRWFALVGSLANRGMLTLQAERPEGPFHLARRNGAVLTSGSLRLNTYYARFFRAPEGVLVHHHAITRRLTRHLRPVCWLAPLKRALVDDEGTLRLGWWPGNEALLGERRPFDTSATVDLAEGVVLTTTVEVAGGGAAVVFGTRRGHGVGLWIHPGGVVTIGAASHDGRERKTWERHDRGLPPKARYDLRLLARDTLVELYLDDVLLQAYSLPLTVDGRLALVAGTGGAAFHDAALHRMTA